MITAKQRKKDILKSINLNPVSIEIINFKKIIVDGHFEQINEPKHLIVRIYHQVNPKIDINSDKIGTYYSNKRYGMLADYKANLNTDSKESIEFDSPFGHMKINAVYPQIVKNELCGYQCSLERIE